MRGWAAWATAGGNSQPTRSLSVVPEAGRDPLDRRLPPTCALCQSNVEVTTSSGTVGCRSAHRQTPRSPRRNRHAGEADHRPLVRHFVRHEEGRNGVGMAVGGGRERGGRCHLTCRTRPGASARPLASRGGCYAVGPSLGLRVRCGGPVRMRRAVTGARLVLARARPCNGRGHWAGSSRSDCASLLHRQLRVRAASRRPNDLWIGPPRPVDLVDVAPRTSLIPKDVPRSVAVEGG